MLRFSGAFSLIGPPKIKYCLFPLRNRPTKIHNLRMFIFLERIRQISRRFDNISDPQPNLFDSLAYYVREKKIVRVQVGLDLVSNLFTYQTGMYIFTIKMIVMILRVEQGTVLTAVKFQIQVPVQHLNIFRSGHLVYVVCSAVDTRDKLIVFTLQYYIKHFMSKCYIEIPNKVSYSNKSCKIDA